MHAFQTLCVNAPPMFKLGAVDTISLVQLFWVYGLEEAVVMNINTFRMSLNCFDVGLGSARHQVVATFSGILLSRNELLHVLPGVAPKAAELQHRF